MKSKTQVYDPQIKEKENKNKQGITITYSNNRQSVTMMEEPRQMPNHQFSCFVLLNIVQHTQRVCSNKHARKVGLHEPQYNQHLL